MLIKIKRVKAMVKLAKTVPRLPWRVFFSVQLSTWED